MKSIRIYSALLVPFLGAALAVACDSASDPAATSAGSDASVASEDAAGDAATTDETRDGGADASPDAACAAYTGTIPNDAGALCHDLVNTAPALPITVDPGVLPVGTGGTLADGLYHMTEVRTYPGSPVTGVTFKIAILVVGDTSYSVNDNSNEAATVRKIEKRNPDGGAGIVVCTTKPAGTDIVETSSTATCDSLKTYDANYKFSTTLTKQ